MQITVRLFASCAEIAGANHTTILVDGAPTVRSVREALERVFDATLVARSMIAINATYANDATVIHVDDDVALIPPVAGG